MKGLASIVFASTLYLSGCATGDHYDRYVKDERASKELIREISKEYKAKDGFIQREQANDFLREFWIDYQLREGQSITLEPLYGPYDNSPMGKINVLLKDENVSGILRIIGRIDQGDIILYFDEKNKRE